MFVGSSGEPQDLVKERKITEEEREMMGREGNKYRFLDVC